MRLPLATDLTSRDGVSNKDSRLTNALKETRGQTELAVIRPGLALAGEADGEGRGLAAFGDDLLAIYDGKLYVGNDRGVGIFQINLPTVMSEVWSFVSGNDVTCMIGTKFNPGFSTYILTLTGDSGWTITQVSNGAWVVFGNGIFVCTHYTSGFSAVSSDGVNWTISSENNVFFDGWKRTLYGSGYFINHNTGSLRKRSANGLTWENFTTPTNIYRMFGNDTTLIYIQSGAVSPSLYKSEDGGANWAIIGTAPTIPPNNSGWEALTYHSGWWYLVSTDTIVLFKTQDFIEWVSISISPPREIVTVRDMVSNGDILCISAESSPDGDVYLYSSVDDGLTWVETFAGDYSVYEQYTYPTSLGIALQKQYAPGNITIDVFSQTPIDFDEIGNLADTDSIFDFVEGL